MAKICYMVCDRCGAKIKDTDKRVVVDYKRYVKLKNDTVTGFGDYDLCDQCAMDFGRFFREKKGAKDGEAEL